MAKPPANEAPARTQAADRRVSFSVTVDFEGAADEVQDVAAYLFTRSGQLLAQAAIDRGKARFEVDRVPRDARLFVGPALGKTDRAAAPSLSTMDRLNAVEPTWRYEAGRQAYQLEPISQLIWPRWPLCRCRVRGRVVVRRVSPGGVIVEAPVCDARVHICEVDRLPWIIARLPEPDIFRLRDELLRVIQYPIPVPSPPDPGPVEEDGVALEPGRAAIRTQNRLKAASLVSRTPEEVALNPQPLPPAPMADGIMQLSATTSKELESGQPAATALDALPVQLRFALASGSSAVIRNALTENISLIWPWICRWPWLYPWFYRSDELRVVTTDQNGGFDVSIWYLCAGDKPDLYFWVEYAIGGVWTTVYHPPLPCNIWWNYTCGTEVTITVTDPRVPGCGDRPDVPGKQVIVKSIGREVSMGEINREPSPANPGADPALAGTVEAGWIDATKESPFGGLLEPRVDFGDGLKAAGITHYRWSYRSLGGLDWTVIDAPVSRHYREAGPAPGDPPVYKSVLIGPAAGVAGYYVEIDPALPAGAEDWEVLDESFDLASAYWDTQALAPGKYELKLELFRVSGGIATAIDLTTDGVGLNQVTDPAPFVGGTYATSPADGDRLLLNATGDTVGYRLVLHVDNAPCFGTITPVSVAPGTNDTKCGFLEYQPGAAATIGFRASHPANYASLDFDVARVATLLPSASASGLVDAGTINGFARSGDLFTKAVAVSTLFTEALPAGETPCKRAAFAESLHVYALATNGYTRLSYLDAPRTGDATQVALRAFALTGA